MEFNNLNRNKIIKTVIIIFVCFFVSFIGATIFSNNIIFIIKEMVETRKNEQMILNVKDFENNGYQIQKNELLALKDDPGLAIYGISRRVSDLNIILNEAANSNIGIQLYYTTGEVGFNAEESLAAEILTGSQSVKVSINKEIRDLRVDLGNFNGEIIPLDRIIINEKVPLSRISTLFKETVKADAFRGIWNDRFILLFLACLFIGLHAILDKSKMYDWIWRKRWIVGGALLLFLVLNRYHGDSMSVYDRSIQPGMGSEYVEPVLGVPRPIRSDEWIVTTPSILASQSEKNAYSKYNSVLRGTKTLNIVSGISRSYAGLTAPHKFLASFLPSEYGFSFIWYSQIIFTFLISLEFCYIIGRKKRLLAATGAFLIAGSSFYMWWGFPIIIPAAQAAIVGVHYFLEKNNKFIRGLCGVGIAIAGACFVTVFYPTWQVPLGYAYIGILIWQICDKFNIIKSFDKKDWLIMGVSIAFMLSLIAAYLLESKDYLEAIMNTVYPGERRSNGEFGLDKIFYYFISILLPYKGFPNASETGTFINFFPLPLIAGIAVWTNNKKEKKDNILLGTLIGVSIFILIYVTTGLPAFIADLSFMSYGSSYRVIDMLGLLQVYIMIIVFSQKDRLGNIKPYMGILGSCIIGLIAYGVCQKYFQSYFSWLYSLCMLSVIIFIGYTLLVRVSNNTKNKAFILLIIISIINVAPVRPIVKGYDPIYSKPVAIKIRELVKDDSDAKWLSYGTFTNSSFMVACGASVINSVNFYPNMELWTNLDPQGSYNNVYNRYAHIITNFTDADTSFEIIQADVVRLNLSYKDIKKTEADYVFTLEKLDVDNENVRFDLIYDEAGCYIYKIDY